MTLRQRLRRLLNPINDAGNALCVRPASHVFGYDRGTPIDRFYIDKFLHSHRALIRGRVLEVAGNDYTLKYGSPDAQSIELHTTPSDRPHAILADLTDPSSLPGGQIDCFICTQTFNFIYDIKAAIHGANVVLAPGGWLLATVGGISQISRYDMDRWGDFWRLTSASCERLFGECFPDPEIVTFGNVLAATAMLRGLAVEDLPSEDLLEPRDANYQVIVGIAAKKPA